MAQLCLAVVVIHKNQLRLVIGDIFFMNLGKSGNDEQITHRSTASGRAIDRNHAAATLPLDCVRDKTLTVVNVPDVNLLVFCNICGIEQILINGTRTLIVQLALRGFDAMNL